MDLCLHAYELGESADTPDAVEPHTSSGVTQPAPSSTVALTDLADQWVPIWQAPHADVLHCRRVQERLTPISPWQALQN